MIGLLIGFLITQTNNYYNASEIFADIASIDWDDESISSQEKVCSGTSVMANHRSFQMAPLMRPRVSYETNDSP